MHAMTRLRSAAALALWLALAGCKKETLSLVVVGATAPPPITQPISAELQVGPVTRTFLVDEGIGDTPVRLGVYVGAAVTGEALVSLSATVGGCLYRGEDHASIRTAGMRVERSLVLHPQGCTPADGGAPGRDAASGDRVVASDPAPVQDTEAPSLDVPAPSSDGAVDRVAPPADRPDRGPLPAYPSLHNCKIYFHHDYGGVACQPGEHSVGVRGLAFSPDGKLLATSGQDGLTRIWNVGTGTTLTPTATSLTTTGNVETLAFSPDGRRLAGAGEAGALTVWKAPAFGEELSQTPFTTTIIRAAFAADSDRIFIGAAGAFSLRIWSASTKAIVKNIDTPAVTELAVSQPAPATGPWWAALATSANEISLVDLAAPAVGQAFRPGTMGGASALALDREGATLAVGHLDGVHLWDIRDKAAPHKVVSFPVELGFGCEEVLFSPSGRHVATNVIAVPVPIVIYSADDGAELAKVTPTYRAFQMAFSPDGKALVVGENFCAMFLYCRD
jgi:hypothetical protein